MSLSRRHFLGSSAALGAATFAMPGLLRAQTASELIVVSFAGQLQEPHRWLADQMEAEMPGLTVRLVPSESQDIVAQIKAAQGFSPYDVMPNGEPPHLIAQTEGYIVPLDAAAVPNAANIDPAFMRLANGFGVPTSYSLIGIAYNEAMVESPPTSWEDLFAPEMVGKVGFPRASSNLGLGALVALARLRGGSESDLEPGWAALEELQPVIGRSPSQLIQMLEREEIAMAPIWNNDAAGAAGKGLPIRFVMPDPGPIVVLSITSQIQGTQHPDLVHEWMNRLLSPEYQARAADAPYFFGPTVTGVAVPEAAAEYTPTTPDALARLQTVDWSVIAPQRGEIVDRFDRTYS